MLFVYFFHSLCHRGSVVEEEPSDMVDAFDPVNESIDPDEGSFREPTDPEQQNWSRPATSATHALVSRAERCNL